MSGARLLALGVGDAFSARYYSACFALQAEGEWLLVDCPHPIRKILREGSAAAGLALDIDQLSAIALTHLHADHCSGLETVGFYGRFMSGRLAQLVTPAETARRLWDGHLAAGMAEAQPEPGGATERRTLADFFRLEPLSEAGPARVGPFQVECRRTRHTVPTVALRITGGGRTIGYSSDTAFDPGLIEWLERADLIVHEAGPGLLHTPYEELLRLPEHVRRRLRLIHYPDTFDPSGSAIEPLAQGKLYEV